MVDYLEDIHLKVGSILVEIIITILRTIKVGYFLLIKKKSLKSDMTKSNMLYVIITLPPVFLEVATMTYK
jgi:hypothetical protein